MNYQSQRIFPILFLRVKPARWWSDSNHIIQSCASAAAARGYRIFSIQDFAECRWGPSAERDYSKYGRGWYCYRGLGWMGSGSVYRVQSSSPGKILSKSILNGESSYNRWLNLFRQLFPKDTINIFLKFLLSSPIFLRIEEKTSFSLSFLMLMCLIPISVSLCLDFVSVRFFKSNTSHFFFLFLISKWKMGELVSLELM